MALGDIGVLDMVLRVHWLRKSLNITNKKPFWSLCEAQARLSCPFCTRVSAQLPQCSRLAKPWAKHTHLFLFLIWDRGSRLNIT